MPVVKAAHDLDLGGRVFSPGRGQFEGHFSDAAYCPSPSKSSSLLTGPGSSVRRRGAGLLGRCRDAAGTVGT